MRSHRKRKILESWCTSRTGEGCRTCEPQTPISLFHSLLPLLLSQTNLYFVPQQEMFQCWQKLLMILSLLCCSGNKFGRIQKILQCIIPINKNVFLTRNSCSDTLPHFSIVGFFLIWRCIIHYSHSFVFFRYLFAF